MERLLKNTKKIIFYRQGDIFSSAVVLSSLHAVARIFGILRYRVLTQFFPVQQIDYILAAFRLPDIIFEVLITGVLGAAFIPLFIKYEKEKEQLYANISSIINFMILLLIVFITITFLGANYIFPLIIPKFQPYEVSLVVNMSRWIMLTQLPFLVVGYILSSIAQSNKIFVASALAPILYSLGSIVGTLLFTKSFGLYGPVIGAAIGAVLFLLVQAPTLLAVNFSYKLTVGKIVAIWEFIRLFTPRVIAVISTQIDLTIDLAISSFLSRGSYTIFLFAQKLQFVPVAFLGIPLAQAAFPFLSEMFASGKTADLKKVFMSSILQLIFLSVPIGVFFIFARTPLIRIVYGGPEFSILATSLSALTLSYYALSIPFHTIYYFIIRAFYATHDTKTPLLISIANSSITVGLSLFFIFFLKLSVAFLALSFSLAITSNVVILLALFYRKIGGFNIHYLLKNTIKIYIGTFAAAMVAYPTMKVLDLLILDTSRTINVFFLLVITFGVYLLSYLFFSWVINIEEVKILTRLILTIKEAKRKIVEIYADVG